MGCALGLIHEVAIYLQQRIRQHRLHQSRAYRHACESRQSSRSGARPPARASPRAPERRHEPGRNTWYRWRRGGAAACKLNERFDGLNSRQDLVIYNNGYRVSVAGGLCEGHQVPHAGPGDCKGGGRPGGGGQDVREPWHWPHARERVKAVAYFEAQHALAISLKLAHVQSDVALQMGVALILHVRASHQGPATGADQASMVVICKTAPGAPHRCGPRGRGAGTGISAECSARGARLSKTV